MYFYFVSGLSKLPRRTTLLQWFVRRSHARNTIVKVAGKKADTPALSLIHFDGGLIPACVSCCGLILPATCFSSNPRIEVPSAAMLAGSCYW